jgi:CRP/FNR family cyclic AMP-dependent transcriptional regulator
LKTSCIRLEGTAENLNQQSRRILSRRYQPVSPPITRGLCGALPIQTGTVIFRKGDTANRFYLIESGKVALESSAGDQVIRIEEVGGGDLLGWSWIFPPFVWHFDARAIEPTTAIFLYGILREHCEADPALGYALFKRMSEVMMRRLQAARVKLSEAIKNAPPRDDVEGKVDFARDLHPAIGT